MTWKDISPEKIYERSRNTCKNGQHHQSSVKGKPWQWDNIATTWLESKCDSSKNNNNNKEGRKEEKGKKKEKENTCWWGRGAIRTFSQCWWGCKLVKLLWKTIWQFLKKLNIKLSYNSAIPLVRIYPRDMKTCLQIHACSLQHYS